MEAAAGVVAVGAVCVVVVVVADVGMSQEGNLEIVLLRVIPS